MNPLRRAGRLIAFGAVTLLVIALAPAVLLGGELVNRRYLGSLGTGWSPRRHLYLPAGGTGRRWRRLNYSGRSRAIRAEVACRRYRFGGAVVLLLRNPVWVMLTAPARWLADRIRPRAGGRRGRGGNGAGGAGVREPRRPLPDPPAGAMALPEPGPFG